MNDWLTAGQDDALRNVDPPPLSAGFTDRVMAGLENRAEPLPLSMVPRASRGRPWARRAVIASGLAAGLLSVGAAASSLMGVPIRSIPVVGTIVQAVAPAPTPKPKVEVAKRPAIVAPKVEATAPAPVVQDEPAIEPRKDLLSREVRREAFAERIADRLDKRAERRRAIGLPPAPLSPEEQAKIRERLEKLPPEERQALRERIREIRLQRRAERAAAGEVVSPLPRLTPEERRARWEAMTPEQQQAARERIERLRALRMQRQAEQKPPEGEAPALPE